MTTSLTRSLISAIPSDGKPTPDQIAFFSRRLKNDLHGEVLRRYLDEKKSRGLTKAELARRMGRDPAQITRWLAAPSNVEIDTISQLLLSMGYVAQVNSVRLADLYRSNHFESDDDVGSSAGSTRVSVSQSERSATAIAGSAPSSTHATLEMSPR